MKALKLGPEGFRTEYRCWRCVRACAGPACIICGGAAERVLAFDGRPGSRDLQDAPLQIPDVSDVVHEPDTEDDE